MIIGHLDGDNIVGGTPAARAAGGVPDDDSQPPSTVDLGFRHAVPLVPLTSGLSSLVPVSIGG
jgi:hypothetical protein